MTAVDEAAAAPRSTPDESEERYRLLVEHAPIGIYVHDGERFLFANQAFASMIGAGTPADVVGREFERVLVPEMRDTVRERISRLRSGLGVNPVYQGRMLTFDGRVLDVELIATRCVFAGRPAIQVAAADVTESRRAEAALRRRDALLRAIIDSIEGAITLVGVEGPGRYRVHEINPFALRETGRTRESFVGQMIDPTLAPSVGELLAQLDRVVADGRSRTFESSAEFTRSYRWILTTLSPVRDDAGRIDRVLIVSVPIDDRKQIEQALEASRERYRALVDAQPDAIFRVRRDGTLIDAHVPPGLPLAAGAAAARGGDAGPRSIADVLPAAVAEGLAPLVHAALDRGESLRFETQTAPAAGASAGAAPPRYFESRVLRAGPDEALVIVRDTTDMRVLHQRLAVAERMASLGTLAAGVAHEINNPLAFVVGNHAVAAREIDAMLARLRAETAPGGAGASPAVAREIAAGLARVADALTDAAEGARRVQDTVRDLKTFSRADEERRELLDVKAVVESSLNMARNAIRHRARLETRLGEVPRVVGNPARLGQVVLNLLMNAADAIAEGAAEHNAIRVALRVEGPNVLIEVADTGAGIAPEALPQIFDPFFTTKPVGQGTGLGLAICHGIVASFGGEIRVQSEPGRGSTFRVLLPGAAAAAAMTASSAAAQSAGAGPTAGAGARGASSDAGGRRSRVLVVDDEPLVAGVVARVLGDAHDVTVATSGREAIAAIEGGARFDAVFCDLMMPEMTGMALYDWVKAHAPGLAPRMVFVTGGAFTPTARDFLARVAPVYVEKPFTAQDLERAIARVLRGG